MGKKPKERGIGGREAVPGWAYVDVISGEGAKTLWKCKFCKTKHTSGGSRVQSHFLGRLCGGKGGKGIGCCEGGGASMAEEFQRAKEILGEWQRARNKKRERKVQLKELADEAKALETGESCAGASEDQGPPIGQPGPGGASKQAKPQKLPSALKQIPIVFSPAPAGRAGTSAVTARTHPTPSATGELGAHKKKRKNADAELDDAIANFCYAEGVAFHKLESPFFHEVIKKAKKASDHYEPPSRCRLSTTLLDDTVRPLSACNVHFSCVEFC
jgi:hypothetical protein